MDNGVLVFIIIALGIVVVWQASKLSQYRRFERMLPSGAGERAPATGDGPASDHGAGSRATSPTAANPPAGSGATAGSESAAADVTEVAETPGSNAVSADASADGSAPRGGDEAHLEEAKAVQQIMARCRYAEFYIDQLDDDYEREEFRRIIDESIRLSSGIRDPMLEATALEPLVLLLDAAGWNERRDALRKRIDEPAVRDRVEAKLTEAESA